MDSSGARESASNCGRVDLRHFAADSHLRYWLERMGYEFDVITDDELHDRGRDAIARYDVVLTTSKGVSLS